MVGVLNITCHQHGFASGCFDQALGVLCVIVLVEIRNEHVGSLAGIGYCHGPPNAAVTTGDDGLLVVEPARALVGVLAVIGDGLHCSRPAGHLLLLFREWRLGPFGADGLVSATLAGSGRFLC
jgi:hypothetical protein